MNRRRPLLWFLIIALPALGCLASVLFSSWLRGPLPGDPHVRVASQVQSTLDAFVAELSHPKEGQRFVVKGRFATSAGPEYLWAKNPTYYSGVFEATLDQDPVAYKERRKGDRVRIPRSDVADWMIREPDGRIRGGFTMPSATAASR